MNLTERMQAPLHEVKRLIRMGRINAAIAVGDGWELRRYDYSVDADTQAAFEDRVIQKARDVGARHFVFATVIVIADDDDTVMMRPPKLGLPPRDFETLIIWLLSVDLDQGFEIGRVDIGLERGKITFGPLMTLVGEHQALAAAPGRGVMAALATTG